MSVTFFAWLAPLKPLTATLDEGTAPFGLGVGRGRVAEAGPHSREASKLAARSGSRGRWVQHEASRLIGFALSTGPHLVCLDRRG